MASINKVTQGARERMADLWVPCEHLCCKHAWKNTCHTHIPQVTSDCAMSPLPTSWTPPFPAPVYSVDRPCDLLTLTRKIVYVYLPASFLRFYRALLKGLQYLSLDKTSPVYSRPGVIPVCYWMHQGHSPLLRMLCIISDSGIVLERDSLHEGCYAGNSSGE